MSVNKNFVVKHGLEVDTNLILADAEANKVGIATSTPKYTLHVNGGVGATNLDVSGISTIKNLVISSNGSVNVGGTTGKRNYLLTSTGVGVTWSKLTKSSIYSEAVAGQTTFYLPYEVGTVEVYVNGVRLAPNEFVAVNGTSVVLTVACFGGEIVEIIANQSVPVTIPDVVGLGITVQDEGALVGTAGSIRLINFIGSGVTVTSASSYGVDVLINGVTNPPGKTIYVTTNGDDINDGLTLDYAKKTVKAAVGIASAGDTVKVSPGTYIENNPITLPEDVSIEGAELRNCIITPLNPADDLFWVSNGNHLTDLSFQGQPAVGGASVIAFRPLSDVASGRFFDAARMIRYNLDFIASEAVGYLTSTNYRSPAFTLSGGDYTSCKDDIKDIFRAVCYDITRGGNSKCVGAGLSYYDGNTLQHIVGVKTETIATISYAAGIARSCINNVMFRKPGGGNYQTEFTQIRDLSMQPDGAYGNQSISGCANVVSAINSCVGVVTTVIGVGTTAIGTIFNRTYPGNSGAGTTDPNYTLFSPGVGNVTKGPYIRNCTNFIANSIGMNVDGFHAEPGDKDDMGITGMMSVDSYTQYNQGGIGVKVSNGAYAQLVSIFTICDDQAILTESGGQCDITNSNSSFGTYGLVSDGLSTPETKSVYHYTAEVAGISSEGDSTVTISGIGKERPYSGQAIYFGEKYYQVESVSILNGGSGYTQAPNVIFTTLTSPGVENPDPSGPSPIKAEAYAEIQNGTVTAVNIISGGRGYTASDNVSVTFSAPTGVGSTAVAVVSTKALYYQVRSATLPVSGVSTITLAQPLDNNIGIGTTVFMFRQSLQIVSSHSFEYIGAGNVIELARPSKGGVTIRDNQIVRTNGGEIVYTSTDQDGNFEIGEGLIIDQATGTIRGRAFERSLLNTVTPFIIALGAK